MADRRITISPRIDRETYFRFKQACTANGIRVERAIEALLRDALERAGVAPKVSQEDNND